MLSRVLFLRSCRAQTPVADRLRFYATPAPQTGKKPDEAKESAGEYATHQAEQNTDFFTASVKSTVGTVWEKAKVAVGLEKPLGKEGAGSMEPAGMMENKSGDGSRAERYSELIGRQKQKSDELTKGARLEDLYSEGKATSAATSQSNREEAFKYDKEKK